MATLQFKRGTSSAIAAADPVLKDGEPCYETDTGKMKIGDGTTAYSSLPYFTCGMVDASTSKLDTNLAPSLSILDVVPVADATARLALTAPAQIQKGDIAIQADTNEAYVFTGTNPATASDWTQLTIAASGDLDGGVIV